MNRGVTCTSKRKKGTTYNGGRETFAYKWIRITPLQVQVHAKISTLQNNYGRMKPAPLDFEGRP